MVLNSYEKSSYNNSTNFLQKIYKISTKKVQKYYAITHNFIYMKTIQKY